MDVSPLVLRLQGHAYSGNMDVSILVIRIQRNGCSDIMRMVKVTQRKSKNAGIG